MEAKKKFDKEFLELTLPQELASQVSIVQPNRITNAQMGYNQRQMDILILILDRLQVYINEMFNKKITWTQLSIFQESDQNLLSIKIPIRDFNVSPKRYGELKQDLAEMAVIPIRFQQKDVNTGENVEIVGGFYTVRMPVKWARFVEIQIQRDIARYLLDLSKGYTRYNKQIALSLKGTYAKRLYMLISAWKNKGGVVISMERFREIMNLEDKYKQYRDLLRWVIQPCYKQLREQSDCWFEVDAQYRDGEKQPYQLVFKIINMAQHKFEEEKLARQKDAIRQGLIQLRLSFPHIQSILDQVKPYNVVAVTGKVFDLQTHKIDSDVKNPDSYYFKALENFIKQL